MKHLMRLGLVIAVEAGSAHEQVGVFFVQKAAKTKVRMILDARRVNQRFRVPPGVALCSSESLSRVEIELPDGVEWDSTEGQTILSGLEVVLGNGDV